MTSPLDVPPYEPQPLTAWPDILNPADEIVIQEAHEGQHGWWCYSREHGYHANDPTGIGEQYHLKDVIRRTPEIVYYGLVEGKGTLVFYDGYHVADNRWLDFDECYGTVGRILRVPLMPVLHRGAYAPGLIESFIGGPTVWTGSIPPATDKVKPPPPPRGIVESVIVRTVSERFDRCGRVCFRLDSPLSEAQAHAAAEYRDGEVRHRERKLADLEVGRKWGK